MPWSICSRLKAAQVIRDASVWNFTPTHLKLRPCPYHNECENIRSLYSKTCLKRPLKKKTKIGFQYQFLLNAGQKYCRMLPLEHSAILLTFIKLPFVNKNFVLSFLSGRLRQVLLYKAGKLLPIKSLVIVANIIDVDEGPRTVLMKDCP